MPDKARTERQIGRLLAGGPRPVALVPTVPASYRPRHAASAEHVARHYRRWPALADGPVDALVITGAPVETLPFQAVEYWRELTEILDWAQARSIPTLALCWAAMAALAWRHGVPLRRRPAKAFGLYAQTVRAPGHPLLAGLGPRIDLPVSRHAEMRAADLPRGAGVTVLADSTATGLSLVHDAPRRTLCVFDHPEYDACTLHGEFVRDRALGRAVAPPVRDPVWAAAAGAEPPWRPAARRLVGNWLDSLETPVPAPVAEPARRHRLHRLLGRLATPAALAT
jgi:homoserine O-succinyltransferase